MSAFDPEELIFWQRVCSLWWDRFMTTWISNFKCSVDGQIIWPNSPWNSVFFYNFRNTESSCKFRPKTDFVLEGWDIACFARVYYNYFNAWHSLLVFLHAAPMKKNPHISLRQIVCMSVLCLAYWCVSLCCSSDLLWYVKIATPTALSASLRPCFFGNLRYCFIDVYNLRRNTLLLFADTPLSAQV